jgi:hypothetical protein
MMRFPHILAVALLLVASAACTVPDDTLATDIGTTRPSLADSDLATQTVQVGSGSQSKIQTIVWDTVMSFLVSGLDPSRETEACDPGQGQGTCELTFETDCAFYDSVVAPAQFVGKCGGGLIIGADEVPRPMVTLETLTLSNVTAYRLAPLILPEGGDYDTDGVHNAEDNCVLIPNPNQQDTGMKGFGDRCATTDPFFGLALVDNDADRVADLVDNCPYTPNPDQADDGTPFGNPPRTVRDGIGNACAQFEQTAWVQVDGIVWNFPAVTDFMQPFRGNSWLTVDFNDQTSFDCDWSVGICTIPNPGLVSFCFNTTGGFVCDP